MIVLKRSWDWAELPRRAPWTYIGEGIWEPGVFSLELGELWMDSRTHFRKRILDDIQAGMGDVPIMEKYQLSPADLMAILLELGHPGTEESVGVEQKVRVFQDDATGSEMRVLPRNYLTLSLTIYDAVDHTIAGVINDITENGLQIEGIPASVGELRSFMIPCDMFPGDPPIEFDAECRWIGRLEANNQSVAGFEITMISDEAAEQLLKLIRQVTLG